MGIDIVDVEAAEGGGGGHGAVRRSVDSWKDGRLDYNGFLLAGLMGERKFFGYFFFSHTPLESAASGAVEVSVRDFMYLTLEYPERH